MKDASHESFVFTSSTLGIRRKPRTKASFSRIMDAIGMLGFQRNSVFFRVNGASVAEKSWLACAAVSGVIVCAVDSCSSCAHSGTEGSRRLFLFFADAVLLCFACVVMPCALELLHPSDELHSSVCNFIACFAPQSSQIAMEWMYQGFLSCRRFLLVLRAQWN